MDMDLTALSARFHVCAEERNKTGFARFFAERKNDCIAVLCDGNTKPYALAFLKELAKRSVRAYAVELPSKEPVADEATVEFVTRRTQGATYLLAVGAGTLNDLAKYSGFLQQKKSGILATAASMDGFSSGVTPLIENGFKITRNAQTASNVLIDYDLLATAPAVMTGAGVGDILAKFCCLADWKMSHLLLHEDYNEEAASLMRAALTDCNNSVADILQGGERGLSALMRALLVSGYAMVLAGSSRPASGAEHHMSHYLEMDFLRRGKPIPLHGVKVGLGTMVSLWLYHTMEESRFDAVFGAETVRQLAKDLPSAEYVQKILQSFGCPTRFSDLDVSKETVREMFFSAYKIRDRFTILALYNREDIMRCVADDLIDLFY